MTFFIKLYCNTIGLYLARPTKAYSLQGHMLLEGEDSQGFLMAQPGVSQEQLEEVLDLGQFIPEEVEDTNAVEDGDAVYDVEDEEDEEDKGAIYEVPYWKTLYSPQYIGKRGGVLGRITKMEENKGVEKRRFGAKRPQNRKMLTFLLLPKVIEMFTDDNRFRSIENPAIAYQSPKSNIKDDLSSRANEGIDGGGSEPVWYSLPRGKKSIKRDWTRISKRGRKTEGTWQPYKRNSTIRCCPFPT